MIQVGCAPFAWDLHPNESTHQCRFTGAAWTDEANQSSFVDLETNVMEDRSFLFSDCQLCRNDSLLSIHARSVAQSKIKTHQMVGAYLGGAYRIRTDDLFHAMEAR